MAKTTKYWSYNINDGTNEFVLAYRLIIFSEVNIGKIYGFSYRKIIFTWLINIWPFDPGFNQFLLIFRPSCILTKIVNSSRSTIMISITLSVGLKKIPILYLRIVERPLQGDVGGRHQVRFWSTFGMLLRTLYTMKNSWETFHCKNRICPIISNINIISGIPYSEAGEK